MTAAVQSTPSICFVGLGNLPVLAREYARLGAGGAELQQTLLARALARRGFAVSMVVADCGQSDGAAWDGIKTYKTFRPDQGIPLLRFIHPRWTSIWSALQRADADIYYASCAGALLGEVALFARVHSRKLVFRIASNTDCDPRSLLVRYWRDKRLYRYGLRRADLVLAQTPQQRQALAENFGKDSRVVASLTDAAGPHRPLHERDIDVLWVGNIRALKRPEVLFELARRLPDLRFHMIGGPLPGARALFDRVQAEATSISNVTFHGPVAHQDIGAFFSRARVLVGTSHTEGFPNTYLQAWANGVPVVAFLDPQQLLRRHALGDAVTDVDSMTGAIAALCSTPRTWESASLRCRHYMETRCNESQMLAPYIEALTGLLPAPRGAAARAGLQ